MKTDILVQFYVGYKFEIPIMGGTTMATVESVGYSFDSNGLRSTNVTYTYFDNESRRIRTDSTNIKHSPNLKTVTLSHRHAIGSKGFEIRDLFAGKKLGKSKIKVVKVCQSSLGADSVYYTTKYSSELNEDEFYSSPEACIEYLTRDLK